MSSATSSSYRTDVPLLTYHDRTAGFASGTDSPSAYLDACLAAIAAREPDVQAWVVLDAEAAKRAAAESTQRWRTGTQLSPIDGMPIGVKDLMDTKDMPTQMGCEAYRGHQPEHDAPMVAALREAGAVILGKTVTTELGGSHPGPTHNPFDPSRSPGGSSSGSAAAVGAGMIPAATGSQVGGSIIRPASYCGNVALKPSQGAISRGSRLAYSNATYGILAGSVEDTWLVSIEIARRIGGDPGCYALVGPAEVPPPMRPRTVAVMETAGWASLPAPARSAFENVTAQLADHGVTVLRRYDHPLIEAFETLILRASEVLGRLTAWEARAGHLELIARAPDKVSARTKGGVARSSTMTVEDYRRALRLRDEMQQAYARLAPIVDGLVAPSSLGPAPAWVHNELDDTEPPMPTGDIVFNAPSSLLGAPSVTLPLTAVAGMPMGVQFMAQRNRDAYAVSAARWMASAVKPVTA